jgi:predicted Rossmann-fold nucleotide-binding protein
MVTNRMIHPEDLELLCVTDDVEAAIAHIEKCAVEKFRLHKRLRPLRVLGEGIFQS